MNNISKLSLVLFGFVAGVGFLISCGGGGSNGVSLPINDADATVPQITDQMFCIGNANSSNIIDENGINSLFCMKQSTKVQEIYNNLSGVYADGWIMISHNSFGEQTQMSYLFYK